MKAGFQFQAPPLWAGIPVPVPEVLVQAQAQLPRAGRSGRASRSWARPAVSVAESPRSQALSVVHAFLRVHGPALVSWAGCESCDGCCRGCGNTRRRRAERARIPGNLPAKRLSRAISGPAAGGGCDGRPADGGPSHGVVRHRASGPGLGPGKLGAGAQGVRRQEPAAAAGI